MAVFLFIIAGLCCFLGVLEMTGADEDEGLKLFLFGCLIGIISLIVGGIFGV